MYIISKHKDYYDGVAGTTGIDKTIVYERETLEIVDNKEIPRPFHIKRGMWNEENAFINIVSAEIDKKKTKYYVDAHCFIVGFCGKLYLGWKLTHISKGWDEEHSIPCDVRITDIVYGYENVKEYLKTEYWRSNIEDNVRYVKSYDPIHVFREINAPVFVFNGDNTAPRNSYAFIINPILKDYGFYKVMDSFTAFQEISMFMGGVLGRGEKEILVVEDKYKIAQHGFDKWSFRKEPESKK